MNFITKFIMKEALRTGICGPDKHAVSRPAFLRSRLNDKRPEPAYRLHLQDRTNLHYLSADPLEGVLPYGRQGDMLKAKSVMHRDYKWRRRCCPPPPEKPTYEREVHRYAQTDIQKGVLPDQVVKFDDDPHMSNYYKSPLVKLKKAYHWPINPITEEALGGRLCYHYPDECMKNRADIWPRGENRIMEPYPIQIPRDRCQVLAHKPKERRESVCCMDPTANMLAYLKTRFPQPNWECWEEVPDSCKRDLPSECCFYEAKTKGPDEVEQLQCPPKGPCPSLYAYK
ncbi:unnamed protein product [Orchesella dallaii]|uniref:Uncharacterized protein n=1 Tax=Orchesella dallaii TaxID=48710 RepID=A0ABP1RNG1_9HEXA